MDLRRTIAALACAVAGMGVAAATEAPGGHGGGACLDPASWSTLDGARPQPASAASVVSRMAQRDVVLLGETHTDDDHHRWQVQALAELLAQRPRMVIGFEMFPRRVQPVLDRWVAGELTIDQFLAQSEWDKVWNMPAELYLPLFQFARINRIPMIALNVDRALSKAVHEKGWDAVPEAEREGVGRPAPPSEAYRDFLFGIYRDHIAAMAGEGARAKAAETDVAFGRFVQSQTLWDRAMAEALARRLAGPPGERPLVVGVMGSGHVRFGHGVPHQLRALGVTSVGTLIPVRAGADCGELRAGLADAVFALPAQALAAPPRPRLGVELEENEGAVRIARVSAGSLAESTGLKAGDRLVEVAGQPANRVQLVIASIQRQPGGTWLPVRVRRGAETLDLVVKFPASHP